MYRYFFLFVLLIFNLLSYQTKNENVIICGVGKNIEKALPCMIKKIEQLGKHFKDYQVIIYENNSTDKTPRLLKKWAKKNKRVTIISEKFSPLELYNLTKTHALYNKAPCRMEVIAYARNKVLQLSQSKKYENYPFLIMTDMDFDKPTSGWRVSEVIASFTISENWDCIAANGTHYYGGCIYDRYAYRDEQYPFGPEILGEYFWQDIINHPLFLCRNSKLHKVYSAFGGIAIYKKNSLKNCWYSGYQTNDLYTFLTKLISILPPDNPHYKYLQELYPHENIIKFIANCGYDGPVVCEHVTLHASMILKGHDKIYVNPNMSCFY